MPTQGPLGVQLQRHAASQQAFIDSALLRTWLLLLAGGCDLRKAALGTSNLLEFLQRRRLLPLLLLEGLVLVVKLRLVALGLHKEADHSVGQ